MPADLAPGPTRWFSLWLVLFLAGCPASRYYRDGQAYEEQAQLYPAAGAYLDALEARSGHTRARHALDGIAEEAFERRLGRALSLERDGEFLQARDDYVSLQRFLERLTRLDARSFTPSVDLAAKIDEMESSQATREITLGDKALATGAFSRSLEHYALALELVPDHLDVPSKVVAAWLAWGTADLESGRYRAAAQRFEAAAEADPEHASDHGLRAAELWAALGHYHLDAGHCRQATVDLRAARQWAPERLEEEAAAARACAQVDVVVEGLRTGAGRIAGIDVRERVNGRLLDELPGATSEFVVLLDASSSSRAGAPDYLVTGALVTAMVESSDEWPTERTTRGERQAPCRELAYSTSGHPDDVCTDAVDVLYTEVEATKTATLSATLRIVDVDSREVVASQTFDAVSVDTVRYAHSFRLGDDQTWVTISDSVTWGVAVDDDVLALEQARTVLVDDARLVHQAVDELVDPAVRWIAERVDVAAEEPDPSALVVAPLR